MLNFFNTKFPKETESGNIYIHQNRLFYNDHGNIESVDLSILKYAYVEILGETPYLFLFDYMQHYVSVLQKGFSNVYPQLSKNFGFNDTVFFKTIKSKKEQKKRIWLKQNPVNYQILEKKYSDFEKGFELQSSPKKFISWDTTYQQIFKMDVGILYPSNFDTYYFKFNYPVRIGSLLVKELEFYFNENERQNIAIQNYFATLYSENNNDSSYYEIKKYWMNEIPCNVNDIGYERKDQNYLTFNLNSIGVSLIYTYDVDFQYDDGATSLDISNYRDYKKEIINSTFQIDTTKTQILEFNYLYEFLPDYKNNPRVIGFPKSIKKIVKNRNVFWITNNETFGFTGDEFAIVFNINDVNKLIIQNVLPAKGGGYVELMVLINNHDYISIYYGEQNSLDQYVQQLKNLLKIEIEVPEPYYNC